MLTKADRQALITPDAALVLPPLAESSSYWQRALRCFYKQPAGIAAAVFIAVLLIVSFCGAWLYPIDPNLQNIGNRFAGPQPARSVTIVENAIWYGQLVAEPQVVSANTEYVRLAWPSADTSYSVQRIGLDSGVRLSLATIKTPWYEDRLDLRAEPYRYLILGPDETVLAQFELSPEPAISKFYAQLLGYIDSQTTLDSIAMPAKILGSDGLGRDNLARLIAGGRISLTIGILAPLLAIVIGAIYGAISAYVGGWLDELLMRIADIVIALPFLLFVILLNVAFGYGAASDGVAAMFLALVLMGWPNAAKLVRGQVLRLRKQAYIEAARLMGGSVFYMLRTHILPSVLGTVLVALSFAIPNAIFTEALLSFLGLGVNAPAASWGSLCQENLHELQRYPHLLLMPAALISLTVLAFNILGDSLRDALAQAGGEAHD